MSDLNPHDPQPGVYDGVPDATYHAIRLPSFHRLAPVAFEGRPWAAYRLRLGDLEAEYEDESTAAMKRGRGLHLATLQPQVYAEVAIDGPVNPKTGKGFGLDSQAFAGYEADHAGSLVLPAETRAQVESMAKCVMHHPAASMLLQAAGDSLEVTIIADIPTPYGIVRVKARPDIWARTDGVMADLKGCRCAAPAAFRRDIGTYHYHGQAGLYSLLAEAVGEPISDWVFIAAEWDPELWSGSGSPPRHGVACYRLDSESLAAGRQVMGECLGRLAQCQDANDWPYYPLEICDLGAPGWATHIQPVWD